MGLPITLETRTGDTPASRRQRQRLKPPDILLTTPEQIALMLSHRDARACSASLRMVIIDELHALASTKRGDLLALDLARLRTLSPGLMAIGLSATVARPSELAAFLVGHEGQARTKLAEIVEAGAGPKADIAILDSDAELPWAGHSARYALPEIYEAIKAHRMSLIFVNTRSQAEMLFQALWRYNDANLPIALHHGSLDVGQRRKVEAAMVAGKLRAVVCTSTLDLGIDWGDVDLVINVGAPKGASRLAQRIGRANHRLDEPRKALLVPANRFEVVECQAALEAAEEGAQDTPPSRPGALDVLAQHVLGMACSEPFDPDALYREVTSASPYQGLTREGFDKIVRFVSTGGYALANYERYAKLKQTPDGRYRISHPRLAQQYRLNVGTIVEAPMVRVRLARLKGGALKPSSMLAAGRVLGEVEEYFIEQLVPGDTFVFAGEVLRFEGMRENDAIVSRSQAPEPKVPSYDGGKFPLSTYLADRVRRLLADPRHWARLPDQVSDWLRIQSEVSVVPGPDEILVETFPRGQRHYLVCYPFEGRLAHQSLGMLLTRRLERGARQAARLRRQRICALRLGPLRHGRDDQERAARPRQTVRRGHARRRSRCLARRIEPDEALLPRLRHHLGADRAPPSGAGKDWPADDGLVRPHLRRASPARARPYSIASCLRRCRNRPDRRWTPERLFAEDPRKNQAYSFNASLAARRAGHARDRPRERSRRCERSLAARGGRGVDSRGDGAACCA